VQHIYVPKTSTYFALKESSVKILLVGWNRLYQIRVVPEFYEAAEAATFKALGLRCKR